LSQFEELRRREAAHAAILDAFDLIEHDGEDLRDRPFLDCKAALARLLRDTEADIASVRENGRSILGDMFIERDAGISGTTRLRRRLHGR
jgi:ATP-dependent DNA ligase